MDLARDINEDYATLDLSPGASLDEVKASYRRLARALHPDLHPGAAGLLMARINLAYQSLSRHLGGREQTKGWKTYKYEDFTSEAIHPSQEYRRTAPRPASTPESWAWPASPAGRAAARQAAEPQAEPTPLWSEPPVGWRLLGVVLEGSTVVYRVEVARRTRSLALPVRCRQTCPHCEGTGRYLTSAGLGRCPACAGRGHISRPERVEVSLPAAWQSGQRIKVPSCSDGSRIEVELNRPAEGRA